MKKYKEFRKWCLGYSGCDGGDMGNAENPSIWLCGIEWGGGHTPEDLLSKLDENVTTPPSGYDNWQENCRYAYNRGALKLLSAINGESVSDYAGFAETAKPFIQGSRGYFKMNLYPVAFKDTNHDRWTDAFSGITGFKQKIDYLAWCAEHRFPQIRQWARTSRPRLIICTGKTRLPQFQQAFLDKKSRINHEIIEDRDLFWGINDSGSLVVIIPFLVNRYGLVKDTAIQKFGVRINELMTNHQPVQNGKR